MITNGEHNNVRKRLSFKIENSLGPINVPVCWRFLGGNSTDIGKRSISGDSFNRVEIFKDLCSFI